MDILMSETCWAHKKLNKIASDIKLVFYSSTITMMHGPINIKFFMFVYFCGGPHGTSRLPLDSFIKSDVWVFSENQSKKNLSLTLILLTWRIWWAPNNASKWQMRFNSTFKGLNKCNKNNGHFTWNTPYIYFNLLTPNDDSSGRTTPLTSKRFI